MLKAWLIADDVEVVNAELILTNTAYSAVSGALAQLGAHHTGSVGVRGSSPLCSMFLALELPGLLSLLDI